MKNYTNAERLTKWLEFQSGDHNKDLYHLQTRIKKRYVDMELSNEKIQEKQISLKRAKFFKDEDGVLRTNNPRHLMPKKDIRLIYNLYKQ